MLPIKLKVDHQELYIYIFFGWLVQVFLTLQGNFKSLIPKITIRMLYFFCVTIFVWDGQLPHVIGNKLGNSDGYLTWFLSAFILEKGNNHKRGPPFHRTNYYADLAQECTCHLANISLYSVLRTRGCFGSLRIRENLKPLGPSRYFLLECKSHLVNGHRSLWGRCGKSSKCIRGSVAGSFSNPPGWPLFNQWPVRLEHSQVWEAACVIHPSYDDWSFSPGPDSLQVSMSSFP